MHCRGVGSHSSTGSGLYAAKVVEGIQGLDAAGISCATSDLASNGDGGMHVDLENVLLRDPTLTAGALPTTGS